MNRLLLAAVLSSLVIFPASAEKRKPGAPRLSHQEQSVVPSTPIEDQNRAIGLPGVALDASSTTERPSGPGGLRNGVGAIGTLTPNSSSSNGQLLNDDGNSIAIPFGAPRVVPE